MKILVLDDNEIIRSAPADYFCNPHDYREDDFTQTKNIREFVDQFFKEEWDEIWIDHDLGDAGNNGRIATLEIYHYMVGSNRKVKGRPRVYVTTMNSHMSRVMASDLESCGLDTHICPISFMREHGISRGAHI